MCVAIDYISLLNFFDTQFIIGEIIYCSTLFSYIIKTAKNLLSDYRLAYREALKCWLTFCLFSFDGKVQFLLNFESSDNRYYAMRRTFDCNSFGKNESHFGYA